MNFKKIYICNDLSNIQLNHSTILLGSFFFCINSRWILNPYWWFWKVQLTSYLCLLRFLISSQRPMFNISKFLKGVSGFSWMKLSCCSTRQDSKHFKKIRAGNRTDGKFWLISGNFQFSNWIFQLLSWMFQVGISYFNLLKFRFEKKKRWSLSTPCR